MRLIAWFLFILLHFCGWSKSFSFGHHHHHKKFIDSCEIVHNTSISKNYLDELDSNICSHSTYVCNHNKMLEYQLECGEPGKKEIFDSLSFLNSLRNKQLGIMGDSVTLLLYHAFRNQLFNYETHEVLEKGNMTLSNLTLKHHWETAYTYYKEFNTTIVWCRVQTLHVDATVPNESGFDLANPDVCSNSVINESNYLIVGVAAWFKPMFLHYYQTSNFTLNSIMSEHTFQKRMSSARTYIKTLNPSLKVIWRLQPHVGPVDELKFLHNITENHWDGWKWANSSECSAWVPRYNHITVNVAKHFGDKVMDWYTLSNKYLDYFMLNQTENMQVHSDSMHYCARGVPRGALLLAQHAIKTIHNGGHSVDGGRNHSAIHHHNNITTHYRHKSQVNSDILLSKPHNGEIKN